MPEWSSGDVLANGIKLHYYRTGGDKPPIVLLHGITDNGLCWTRLARNLEPDYDLIMVDARGHGLSAAPTSGYAAQDHAADVAGLIEALALEEPVLIGHSMGAATAAVTAATYPGSVGGVVLEDPPWWAAMPVPADPQKALEEWRAGITTSKAKTVEELVALCRAESPNVVGFMSERFTPWQEVAQAITCPALLVTADTAAGSIVSPEIARKAAALMPNCRVAYIPGAGHNIRREQFEPFVEIVRGFLKENVG